VETCGIARGVRGYNLSKESYFDIIGAVTVIGKEPTDLSERLIESVLLTMLEVMADLSFTLDFSWRMKLLFYDLLRLRDYRSPFRCVFPRLVMLKLRL
jgi:hypothetical protein